MVGIEIFLAGAMAGPETGWSVGTFGAIAESLRDPDEPVSLSRAAGSLSAVTARGGIRIETSTGIRLIASETATNESWNHRVALCLARQDCAMSRRSVVTEIGPDPDALREQDRSAILFGPGLGPFRIAVCLRVSR